MNDTITAPRVLLETSLGNISLELDAVNAPLSTRNFIDYVEAGHYDGLVFHRVISGFMIQGGGYDENYRPRTTRPPIKNEAANGLSNQRGTIAMARTNDPHSATAQFFINLVDNRPLDYPSRDGFGYAAFGKVIKGMEVVNGIANVRTGNNGPHQNVPLTPVVIQSARVVEVQP